MAMAWTEKEAVHLLSKGFAQEARKMGQELFLPPDVAGWRGGESWLMTTSLLVRFQFAESMAKRLNASVLGGKVRGGLSGVMPSLTNLDNGDLKYEVDFRSVYYTLVDGWFKGDANTVLGKAYKKLAFIKVFPVNSRNLKSE